MTTIATVKTKNVIATTIITKNKHADMVLKRKITKEEIQQMPIVTFEGRIIVIQTEEEAIKAVSYLKTFSLLGIDSETRPSFSKGQSHKVALLQVSTDECCFLFRLNMIGLVPAIISLLEDADVVKVGLSLHDDFMMLHKRASFTQRSCIELQDLIPKFGIRELSLQKIYAILFGQKISKSQRLSNWESEILTDKQKMYASIDAWACIQVYRQLMTLKATADYDLEPEIIEEQPKEVKQ
jgi:ribonuclease D